MCKRLSSLKSKLPGLACGQSWRMLSMFLCGAAMGLSASFAPAQTIHAPGSWRTTLQVQACNYTEVGLLTIASGAGMLSATYSAASSLDPDKQCGSAGPIECERLGFFVSTDELTASKMLDALNSLWFACFGISAKTLNIDSATAASGSGEVQQNSFRFAIELQSGAPVTAITAWEFFNTNLNHYFVTAGAGEAQAIDTGAAGPGWSRTGLSFGVYPLGQGTGVPVCRFYGTPGRGPNSHFYTANAAECEWVKTDPGWTYEGLAFNTVVPSNGICPTGLVPVYRVYNNRWSQNDSNHRYTASLTAYQQMTAGGWSGEGVVMCAPSASTTQ